MAHWYANHLHAHLQHPRNNMLKDSVTLRGLHWTAPQPTRRVVAGEKNEYAKSIRTECLPSSLSH